MGSLGGLNVDYCCGLEVVDVACMSITVVRFSPFIM